MITCNLKGGLGNQLFQIFTVFRYALVNNKEVKFINKKVLGLHNVNTTQRKTYWTSFLDKVDSTLLMDEYPDIQNIYREKSFEYNDISPSEFNSQTIMLDGYFQSYLYFQDTFNYITKFLSIDTKKKDTIKKALKYHCVTSIQNCVSMHFRLGDYKNLPQFHPILGYEYYKKSLDNILSYDSSMKNVLYFCEDDDIDSVNITVDKLRNEFPNLSFNRASSYLNDWEQMLLMSNCNHNIIANSTYSWWGAYFNTNQNKIVCYPSIWFGEFLKYHNLRYLFPPEWTKISL
jgi:hypothetical protein